VKIKEENTNSGFNFEIPVITGLRKKQKERRTTCGR
jgi:hypothetical protein